MQDRFSAQFGTPSERAQSKIKPYMVEWVQEFIRHSPFIVLSTSGSNGDCDASPKGGLPGFVKIINEKELIIPDVAGNKLFQGYRNIQSNPKAGVLFFIPGCRQTVRVNGRVSVVSAGECGELKVFDPDDKAKVLQGLRLEVDEAYSHCPRSLTFSKLWDAERIEANQKLEFLSQWKSGI